jgi:hypothetical protein
MISSTICTARRRAEQAGRDVSQFPPRVRTRGEHRPALNPKDLDRIVQIADLICDRYHVTFEDLESHDRHERLLWPRLLAIGLSCRETTASLRHLGLLFNRHIGSICYCSRALQDRLDSYPQSCNEYASLVSALTFNDKVSDGRGGHSLNRIVSALAQDMPSGEKRGK